MGGHHWEGPDTSSHRRLALAANLMGLRARWELLR